MTTTDPIDRRPVQPLSQPGNETIIKTADGWRQIWRQYGWIDHQGRMYDLGEPAPGTYCVASFSPLWVLVDDEPIPEPDPTTAPQPATHSGQYVTLCDTSDGESGTLAEASRSAAASNDNAAGLRWRVYRLVAVDATSPPQPATPGEALRWAAERLGPGRPAAWADATGQWTAPQRDAASAQKRHVVDLLRRWADELDAAPVAPGDALDLNAIDADLDEVRANVDHGEAQYNPWALQALRAAERLVAEVRRLRGELADEQAAHAKTCSNFDEYAETTADTGGQLRDARRQVEAWRLRALTAERLLGELGWTRNADPGHEIWTQAAYRLPDEPPESVTALWDRRKRWDRLRPHLWRPETAGPDSALWSWVDVLTDADGPLSTTPPAGAEPVADRCLSCNGPLISPWGGRYVHQATGEFSCPPVGTEVSDAD